MPKTAMKAKKVIPVTAFNDTPTAKQYVSLQEAFSYYDKHLFKGELPPVLITFQRQPKSYGYYWPGKLISRQDGSRMSEIALAINHFDSHNDLQILSTLVHEMVHHWQQFFGKPSRNGYHNKEWAAKMKEVGLYPSSTGQPEGEETGQRVSHYIMPDGVFKRLSSNLKVSIDWNSAPEDEKLKKKQAKTKYVCPVCDAKAWGKPDLNLVCGDDNETMEIED
jgi:hypothetical protein